MKRVLSVLLTILYITVVPAVEDNNPCMHSDMKFNRYVGTVTLSRGTVPEQVGRCDSAVNVCQLAENACTISDTFEEEWICDACNNYTENRKHDGHNPEKSATCPGGPSVTGAGTYNVTVSVGCSCGECMSQPLSVEVPVTISHSYQDASECDVFMLWYDQPNGPTPPDSVQNCTLSQSSAKQQAEKLVDVSGHCYSFQKCSACGDETSKRDLLSETTGASGGENAYNIYKRVQCAHYNTRKDYTITLEHNLVLQDGTRQGSCHFTGSPSYYSVQDASISIPVGATRTFQVNFAEQSRGSTKYTGYKCSRCSLSHDFADPLLISHEPETDLPPQTGSGTLTDPQPQYPYEVQFNTAGETQVRFRQLCQTLSDRTITHEGMTFENVNVPGCSQSEVGEYDFSVRVVTVDRLTVNSAKHDAGAAALELPTLPSWEPAPSEKVYVKAYRAATANQSARWETILQATPRPSGDWPDGYPVWTRYPEYTGPAPDPLLIPVENNPGRRLSHPGAGIYVVVARCGVNNLTVSGESAAQPNPAHAKSLALCVIDPVAVAAFDVPVNEEGQKVIDYLDPCSNALIKITFGGDRNYTPEGEKAILSIDADPESYELYQDPQGQVEAGAEYLELPITADQTRRDVYLLPIQNDSSISNTYKITTRYGIANTSLKADDAKDTLTVTWATGDCSGDCSTPDVNVRNSSISVQAGFGRGSWGKSGGAFAIYSEELNYRLLDRFARNGGEDGNGETVELEPMLNFIYGSGSAVKVAQTADETSGSGHVAGYPIRVCTGQYCSEFTYRKATVGSFTFVDKLTMTQYLSTGMDPETAMSGNPVAVITVELLHDAAGQVPASGPVITALNVTQTQYVGSSESTRSWSFTAPELTCPELTGDYTVSQLSENGVPNILFKQETTVGGAAERREIRYVGSLTAPAAKEDRTYRKFSWGEELISETENGGTTTYAYYTEGNGFSKLQKITYPQGNYITYTYNTDHTLASSTEVRGELSEVTTYQYAYDETSRKRTITTQRKVGDTVIGKSRSVTWEDLVSTEPDESIRYDENDAALVTKTWYVQGPNGEYDRRIARQENPNGTVTVYTYNRSGATETTTTESGVFNDSGLTLGTRQVSVSNGNGVNVSSETWFIDTANGVNVKTASTVNSNFDAFGRAQTTTYLDGSTVTRTYGCCGVETETDRNGVVTTYAYDEFKRLSHTIRDGITTLYSYDAAGNQTAVTTKGRDDGELTTSSTYSDGELASTTDAMGEVTTYTRSYATSGGVTTYTETTTNPDNSTQITTSVNGAQTSVGGTAVHPQSYEYGPNWQKTLPQNQMFYTDMLGRQYKTTYADGNSEIQYYNEKEQLVRSVTPAGRTTLYEYDMLGRLTKEAFDMNDNGEIDADDLVTETAYSYDIYEGKAVAITVQTRIQGSVSTVISTVRQSVNGLENWTTDMAGLTTHTKLERNGNGSVTQVVFNPDGSKLVTEMLNGRVMTVKEFNTDGTAGNVITYSYDEFNRQVGSVETLGNTTVNTMTRSFDAAGRPVSETINGQTTTYAYDIPNRKRTITRPGNRVVVEEYHPTGELKKLSGADTYTQEWTWDPIWGQKATLTTWKDASTPQVTTWTYDNRGNLSAKKYADDNGPSYTYDADGNLLTRTWARGVTTTYTYDPAGRFTGQEYSDNTAALSLTLNSLNRALAITDASGTWNFTYNTKGWLVKETVPTVVNSEVIHNYDAFGRRTELRTVSGNRTFAYDVQNRVASIGNSGGSLHYTYRSGMQQLDTASWRNGEGVELNSRTFAYDVYHRLTGIELNGVSEVGYTLNDRDQRTAVQYPGVNWNYGYDDKGQLTGAEKSVGDISETYSYTYDGIGNRLTAQEGTSQFSYTSNLLNQYTQVNAAQPTYDVDGNMLTTGDGWIYAWNGENRLIRAENEDTVVEMNYDYAGRRFEKKVYANSEAGTPGTLLHHYKYIYDGYKLVELYDNDTLQMSFTWQPESVSGLDVPISMAYEGNTYYYVIDGNKNVTALLDLAGNRVANYTYGPFGQVLSMDGALAEVNPFRFSSEFHDDETGLVYYNYRYYSPSLGRWTKRDYIEEIGGINLYVVTSNDVQNYFDLFGLQTRAKGHHIVPWSLLNNPKLFNAEAAEFLNSGAAIIQIPNGHNYSRHSAYNKVVSDLLENFCKSHKTPLTEKQAKEFLGIVKECPFIREFNKVAPRGPQAIKAWFDREGFNLLPEELKQKALNAFRRARKRAMSKIGKKVFSNMAKAGLKSAGMAWTLFVVFTMKSNNASAEEIAIAVYDDMTLNAGSTINKAYWDLSNEIAQGAMDKAFSYVHGEEDNKPDNNRPLPNINTNKTLKAGDSVGWPD